MLDRFLMQLSQRDKTVTGASFTFFSHSLSVDFLWENRVCLEEEGEGAHMWPVFITIWVKYNSSLISRKYLGQCVSVTEGPAMNQEVTV